MNTPLEIFPTELAVAGSWQFEDKRNKDLLKTFGPTHLKMYSFIQYIIDLWYQTSNKLKISNVLYIKVIYKPFQSKLGVTAVSTIMTIEQWQFLIWFLIIYFQKNVTGWIDLQDLSQFSNVIDVILDTQPIQIEAKNHHVQEFHNGQDI